MQVKGFKKRLFIICAVIVSLLLLILYSILFSLGNNGTIGVTTLGGDESLVRDLEVSGFLGDYNKNFSFEIKGDKKIIEPLYGKADKTILQYQYYWNYPANTYYYALFTGSDWYQMTLGFSSLHSVNSKDYMQISKKTSPYHIAESKVLKIDMVPKDREEVKILGDGRMHLQNSLKVMELIDDVLYFVIPNDERFTGKSSIYAITAFDKGEPRTVMNEKMHREVVYSDTGFRKLGDIDLKDGRVEIKGLFGEGDKLYIIVKDQEDFKVKVFNLKQERFVDEVVIVSGKLDDRSHFLLYGNLYNNKLSIAMDFIEKTRIVTLEYKDKFIAISDIDIHPHDYKNKRQRIHDVIYKNDLLYIIDEVEYSPYFTSNENSENVKKTYEYYLMLSAYDNEGRLRYSGRIETDLNEDYITGLSRYENILREYYFPSVKRRYYDARLR
jgi:hypothetical protein